MTASRTRGGPTGHRVSSVDFPGKHRLSTTFLNSQPRWTKTRLTHPGGLASYDHRWWVQRPFPQAPTRVRIQSLSNVQFNLFLRIKSVKLSKIETTIQPRCTMVH